MVSNLVMGYALWIHINLEIYKSAHTIYKKALIQMRTNLSPFHLDQQFNIHKRKEREDGPEKNWTWRTCLFVNARNDPIQKKSKANQVFESKRRASKQSN